MATALPGNSQINVLTLGNPSIANILNTGAESVYILIFEVDSNDIDSDFFFEIRGWD